MSARADIELVCCDCRQPFVWTAARQQTWASKGWTDRPLRCTPCASANRVRRDAEQAVRASAEPIERRCVECLATFEVTSGEQEWMAARGFPWPKRCKQCRAERRANETRSNDDATS